MILRTNKSLEKGNRVLRSIENTIEFLDNEMKNIHKTQKSMDNFLTGPFISEKDKLRILEE